ncbi:hypothetical protein SGLAD_v1c00720 [Spiroplasma gladiatoris]|uniref:Uncharacterized protein n=1 Tax=Spiroplasma gladiatoris TaxID=2143 RepID=A0A4P7AHX8_9MOLU|nr:hypothetical protein [Spiroplasma gladiatoris]QBQ07273.1 hypothetical protein SGLAD_v1c00720 [Spiroplasma gladiatoris]
MNDVKKDYKWYFSNNIYSSYTESNYYLIPLKSDYHDKPLPENKLHNLNNKEISYNTSSISISKTYINKVNYEKLPKQGDFLLEYRMEWCIK